MVVHLWQLSVISQHMVKSLTLIPYMSLCSLKLCTHDLEMCKYTPIFKKGRKDDVNNYRPVSLTCILCKVMESIVRNKIMEHFVLNKLFTNRQFCFLKGRSTVTQLLQILDDWTETLESGGRIDVIYTDFEKAFDKVLHRRLLSKLKSYKLHTSIIDWIKDFLTDRKQRVRVNGEFSCWAEVLSGIPQGSILGHFCL